MTSLMGLVEQIMSAPDEDRRALWAMLSPEEMVAIREVLDSADAEEWIAGRAAAELRAEAEADGPTWLRTMFPLLARGGFAPHMVDLWAWAWGIEPRVRSRPYVAAWFRGGSKSATAEGIIAALGARSKRHYCLYISGTQDQADKHVGSIGALLESRRFAAAYPEMARRAVGQYGASKGWSRTRLSTSTGFTIDALGLGVDARGIRMEDERPDFICHEVGTPIDDDGLRCPVEEHPSLLGLRSSRGLTVRLWGLPFEEVVTPEHRYWSKTVRASRNVRPPAPVASRAGWVEAEALTPASYIGHPIDMTEVEDPPLPVYKPGQHTTRDVVTGRVIAAGNGWAEERIPELSDPEWWWAIGLWWGDGHVAGPYQIAWTVANTAPAILARLTTLLARDGRHWSVVPKPGCVQIVTSHAVLNRWLRTWKKAPSRKEPAAWVERLALDQQRALIGGYLDADGYCNGLEVKLTSIHLSGLLAVRRILARLGVAATIRQGPRGRVERFPGRLLPSVGQDKYDLRFQSGAAQFGYDVPEQTRYKFGRTFIDGGYLWSKVRSLEWTPDERKFAPIRTESRRYLTAFGLSHNCLDDVDALTDGPAAVKKKIDLITQTILPSGSKDLIVLAIQNIIHPNSVFARLANVAEDTADFLADRIVSGPVPAVHGLDVEPEEQADGGTRWVVKGGVPTWEFYDLETVQAAIDTEGLTAFLREAQHQVEAAPGGMFDHLVFRRCRPDEVPPLLRKVCWMDPAVTDTDASDSQGIQIDGIAADHTIYRLWSWEARTSPQRALTLAVRMAVEYGCGYVGVETDQGGDTWRSVYNEAAEAVRTGADGGEPITDHRMPGFTYEKAGSGHGSKVHRASQMLADYERAQAPVHVLGTHVVLEAALRRFPKTKPLDLCLAAGTLIATDDGPVPIEDVRRGDTVLTRDGWRPVVVAGMTSPAAELWRLSTDGGWLDGTAEHPVWVEGCGWVPLAEVRYGDIVLVCDHGTRTADSPASRPAAQEVTSPTLWSSRALRSSSTKAATTTARSGRTGRTARSYTGRSGSQSTGRSLTAWIFTMLTAITATTTRRTWPRLPASNIDGSTARRGSRKHSGRTSKRSGPSPQSGTAPTRDASGTVSTADAPGRAGSTGRWSVRSAARSSRPGPGAWPAFARLGAATPSSTATPPTTRTEPAPSAAAPSRRGSTASRRIAGARVRAVSKLASPGPVYNLTVAGAPEFFANGVLVHNCDASFYGWLDLRMGRATKIKTPTGSMPPTPISRQGTGRMGTIGRVTRTR